MTSSNLNSLIAEDDEVISELISCDLQEYFGDQQTRIDEVYTVGQALERLKDNHYDVIISDYHFRDNKGDVIRASHPTTPFIFISGGLPQQIEINQVDTYSIDKPFKTKDLHTIIKRALKLH